MTEQADRLVAGRYRLGSVLGRGGMGTVWRATDEMLDRAVAVKEVLVRDGLTDAERATMRERTLREARATARLSHPGIVTVHDVVDEDDRPWIVMELVQSRSLQEILDADGPLPPARVAELGRQMIGALRAAHAVGILHRDVKPANVLIAEDGRAVLTDFGIAQTAGDSALTQTGLLVGSPAYLPPERARGERASAASDLWAVGATLYAAVEGRPPFQRGDAMAQLAAVITEEPPPPRLAGPLLTPALGALLLRDPAQRATAEQAEELLAYAVGGTGQPMATTAPVASPTFPTSVLAPDSPSYPQPQPARSANVGMLVLVGALVTVVIVLAVVLVANLPGGEGGKENLRQADVTPPAGSSGSDGPTPATPAQTTKPRPSNSPAPVPAGLRRASGPGYSIAVPDGWTRSVEGNSVFWRDPSSAAYVQVDRTEWAGDPLSHWRQFEREVLAKGTLRDYRRISLTSVPDSPYEAADLEFTWYGQEDVPMHGIDRGTLVGGRPYAVFVAIPADQWDGYAERVKNILGSFLPRQAG